jgi:hypothetical protein
MRGFSLGQLRAPLDHASSFAPVQYLLAIALGRTSRSHPLGSRSPFWPTPIDLAFIDGMHLFEFALRDFINVERYCEPSSVVVFDDMLPRDVDEAARERHTQAWTGDVFKLRDVLVALRPDLRLTVVDTEPTGLLIVSNLSPTNRSPGPTLRGDRRGVREARSPTDRPRSAHPFDRRGSARRALDEGVDAHPQQANPPAPAPASLGHRLVRMP